MSTNNMLELNKEELKSIQGGDLIVFGILGAMSAAAYLYEWGYNYADKKFKNAK